MNTTATTTAAIRAVNNFQRRRFTDPVSEINANVHDKTRLLALAVEMVDNLGLRIVSAEAVADRNNSIHVVYGPACDALDGAEVGRHNGNSHWCAHRFGTEIRWVVLGEAA